MTGPTMTQAICTEHAALLRMWGHLQNHLSVQCQAHAKALEAMASEVLRLRVDLLITRTALYWGMAPGGTDSLRKWATAATERHSDQMLRALHSHLPHCVATPSSNWMSSNA